MWCVQYVVYVCVWCAVCGMCMWYVMLVYEEPVCITEDLVLAQNIP